MRVCVCVCVSVCVFNTIHIFFVKTNLKQFMEVRKYATLGKLTELRLLNTTLNSFKQHTPFLFKNIHRVCNMSTECCLSSLTGSEVDQYPVTTYSHAN